MAAGHELLLELGILEDLAVLGHPDRAILVAEGLAAAREIDDRQPARSHCQAGLDVDVLIVWTAMGDRSGHRK